MKFTDVFWKNAKSKERITINQGGTSSSKTYSILQKCILRAYKNDGTLTSIVSESMPHLKRGAMRDFFSILINDGAYNPQFHNKTDNTYKINNSLIEFFSADNDAKVRGARRDYLYMNECNNISAGVFDQLEVRTRRSIDLDYNPVAEFWVHEKVIPHRKHTFIKSTYVDNNQLEDSIIKSIEARKDIDPDWWNVYGLGNVGNVQGLIFNNWQQAPAFPEEIQKVYFGLDFGFTNDPTCLLKIGLLNDVLYVQELVYQTGLLVTDLCKLMKQMDIRNDQLIIADSANPESIAQIKRSGFQCIPATKGKGSINQGIDLLKQKQMMITKDSTNIIKELRNYKWKQDRDGASLNVPVDLWNHAIDALRYANSEMMQGTKDVLSYRFM